MKVLAFKNDTLYSVQNELRITRDTLFRWMRDMDDRDVLLQRYFEDCGATVAFSSVVVDSVAVKGIYTNQQGKQHPAFFTPSGKYICPQTDMNEGKLHYHVRVRIHELLKEGYAHMRWDTLSIQFTTACVCETCRTVTSLE
jgi:hypothetical protein